MSKISSENKEKIINTKLSDDLNKIIESSSKEDISIDGKDDSGLHIKSKDSIESPSTSSQENYRSFTQSLSNEQLNIPEDKNIINKTISPEINYFLCNENYYKEKILEGSNYKKKSKNYILKEKLNYNNIKIDDLNLDKINDILKDIESLENNQNESNNKLNYDKNDFIDIENINFNQILIRESASMCVNKFSLFPYVNINNFNCKFFYYYFIYS